MLRLRSVGPSRLAGFLSSGRLQVRGEGWLAGVLFGIVACSALKDTESPPGGGPGCPVRTLRPNGFPSSNDDAVGLVCPSVVKAGGARPVLVWVKEDPRAEVVGSDMPRVALYDDGHLIYWTGPTWRDFREIVLSPAERERFLDSCRPGALESLAGKYEFVVGVSDLPSQRLILWDQDEPKTVEVYGYIEDPAERRRIHAMLSETMFREVPSVVPEVLEFLASFEDSDARTWRPACVELVLTRFANAPRGSAAVFPEELSRLRVGADRVVGDTSSLFYRIDELEKLMELVRQERPLQYSGSTWAAAMVRLPFPMEELWLDL